MSISKMDDTSTTMDCLKKVREEIEAGWTGPNKECEYGPCHYAGQDCTYCFCPFYPCNDEDLGESVTGWSGKPIWSCLYCHLIHRTPVCRYIASRISELEIKDPEDKRLRGILDEAKERFMVPGKAIMVLGATSDAGKSITAMALCRVISRKGYSVTPMKTQNMSLNSMIASDGSEVASIQMLQAKAARIRHPSGEINPILLKPMRGSMTQVVLNGKDIGLFDVPSYYDEFIPNAGTEAVKKSIETLKERYEYVVMEGAGSPAEINIYDKDIANMRAAEIADADCILVVNMKWGGAFAYALGTVELLSDDDRKRIKGIIFNNMYGDPSPLDSGIKQLESMLGIPVLGVIPHLDIHLPTEDSLGLNASAEMRKSCVKIAVIKLPKIANFTDMDPLYRENAVIEYVEHPHDLENADVIIIPDTKDTAGSVEWLKNTGMGDAIAGMKGKIPMVGISGGYQLMGEDLELPGNGVVRGLGLFKAAARCGEDVKRQVSGKFSGTGEDVKGYELHTSHTRTEEQPLFILDCNETRENEGSFDSRSKLFGTYVHGSFDMPGFRRYILTLTGKYVPSECSEKSYDEILDETFGLLADAFESSVNMELFDKIMDVKR
ncbi:MAG: cobyric acid synthase [Methanomassiliicoccaceae archaeon]|nr:cobyric acid synthase [Methanomassiliicoccaceae archaeon]